jgi:hypothetical protein
VRYCESKNLYLVIGYNYNSYNIVWGCTNCNDTGVDPVEFLNSPIQEILNQDNDPAYCSAGRLEVTDITLVSIGLLGRFKSWEVSSERVGP